MFLNEKKIEIYFELNLTSFFRSGPLQACSGSDQYSSTFDRQCVEGLCSTPEIWRQLVQMQTVKEGGAWSYGDHYASTKSVPAVSRTGNLFFD